MEPNDPDPRAQRTRDAILHAFVQLVFSRRYDAIRVVDLIAAAGVGRSTFYEHFRGKDDVLIAATEPILRTLANAALGRTSEAQLRAMLGHVWEQRGFARRILDGRTGRQLQDRLAAMIAVRLEADGTVAIAANGAAAAQLTMLRLWVTGAIPCSPAALAPRMKACARLLADPAQVSG